MAKNNTIKDKTGKLKPKYADMPRYNTIFGYENAFKADYRKINKKMTNAVVKKIATSVAQNKKNS